MDDYNDIYNSDESKQQSDNDDELGHDRDLKKSLKFDNFDGKKSICYYDDDDDEEEEEEDEEDEDGDITESLLVQMGYGKTESKNRVAPSEEVEEEEYGDIITEESLNQMDRGKTQPIPKHEPLATPISADNLKSAMKGSSNREEKFPGKERKVTWADDVFDSIPSHFTTLRVEARSHSHKSRQKWGKEKNKSGGTGKDKNRKGGAKGKKFSGSSKKCFDSPLDEEDGT